jgi:hypothetical protein
MYTRNCQLSSTFWNTRRREYLSQGVTDVGLTRFVACFRIELGQVAVSIAVGAQLHAGSHAASLKL